MLQGTVGSTLNITLGELSSHAGSSQGVASMALPGRALCASTTCELLLGVECVPAGASPCSPDEFGNIGRLNVGWNNWGVGNQGDANVGNGNQGDKNRGTRNNGDQNWGVAIKGNGWYKPPLTADASVLLLGMAPPPPPAQGEVVLEPLFRGANQPPPPAKVSAFAS
ncbi:hypothetical protein H632_c786p0, partial [Helicosporidium sp. ATCC 50920]